MNLQRSCFTLERSAGILAVALVLCTAVQNAVAAEVPWKRQKFSYVAQGKPIRDFLREFGASQGFTVVVAKDVEGTVNGKFDLLPESLIALMGANFGFVWYFDGSILHVSSASEVRTEVIRLSAESIDRFRQALEQLQIPDPRFPITYEPRQGTALVSGPARYVELVLQTARAVGLNQRDNSEVHIIPLRFAWAADSVFTQYGRDVTVPGVATVMSQLYGTPGSRAGISAAARPRSGVDKLRGLGLASNKSGTDGEPMRSRHSVADAEGSESGPLQGSLPQFVADARTNSILVRDLPERFAAHEAAVRALDVKPGVVEIEVRIIEVNSEETESLGVDWRARSGRVDLQAGRPGLPSLSWGTALTDQAPAVGPNGPNVFQDPPAGVLTTVLGDAGRYLIARVNALAQEGKANLLSSPKLMTLDNVEAVLEDLSTFFVRVQGNLDVDLFNVSAGTAMRVTPLIVSEGGERQLKLAIRIEDGTVTSQSVDGVPVVRRSRINTQAMIADGQALLIAGYAQEESSKSQAGVPGLASLPVLGWLFKNTAQRKTKVERLFLLTPRILNL